MMAMNDLYDASIDYNAKSDVFRLSNSYATTETSITPLNYDWYKEYWYPVKQEHFHYNTKIKTAYVEDQTVYNKSLDVVKELLRRKMIQVGRVKDLIDLIELIASKM